MRRILFGILFFLLFSPKSFAVTRFDSATNTATVQETEDDEDVYFGRYKIWLSMGKPTFRAKAFEQFYGTTGLIPTLGADRNFFQFGTVGVGFGLRLSYYKDSGSPARKVNVDNPSDDELVPDPGSLALTLIPVQFLLTGQVGILPEKAMVLSFWGGLEELYFEEARVQNGGAAATTTTTTTGSSTTTSTTTDNRAPLNSGAHNSIVAGAALNINMSMLGMGNASSLRYLNLQLPYISPFLEVSAKRSGGRTLLSGAKTSSVDFSRKAVIGLAFVFETIN